MAQPERLITMSRQAGKTAMLAALRQARERGYLDGWADGYQEAMEQFASKRRLVGEALLALVSMVAVTLLLASRWGAF